MVMSTESEEVQPPSAVIVTEIRLSVKDVGV